MFCLRVIHSSRNKSIFLSQTLLKKFRFDRTTPGFLEDVDSMWTNTTPASASGGSYGTYVDDYSSRRGRGRAAGRGWRRECSSWRQQPSEPGMDRGRNGSPRGTKRDRSGGSAAARPSGQGFGRHPPGLRGKDIGMWYASRSAKNTKEVEQHIGMNHNKANEIENLLERVKDGSLSSAPSTFTSAAAQWSAESVDGDHSNAKVSTFQRQFMQHRLESDFKELGNSALLRPDNLGISRDVSLDDRLLAEFRQRESDPKYQEMLAFRKKLPSYDMSEEIMATIRENQVVVISGETGCGKTTQVPQFILDDYIKSGNGSLCHIVCTQPRRISAISVAERVASERNERCGCGNSVGYQIRLEEKFPRLRGSMRFCTTGMVLRFLEGDEWLKMASHLIMDEVHERDLDSDFLMIIVKDLLQVRPDLKLILMSATLNADKFSKYFGNCKMLNIPGFTFPVKEYYLEDVLEMTRYSGYLDGQQPVTRNKFGRRDKKFVRKKQMENEEEQYETDKETFLRTLQSRYSANTIESLRNASEDVLDLDLIHALLRHICTSTREGAILVFLTGWEDIKKMNSLLDDDAAFPRSRYLILPLHSLMPTVNQKAIFERPSPGTRKIILSTNIAETSITIDDVIYVIDSGKIKLTRLDLELNVTSIQAEWVSLANAKQRRGRAGRVQPGVCYHLYSKHREGYLDSYQLPAILREKLEMLCLRMKMLKLGKIEPYLRKALDPPSAVSVDLALKLLVTLNALDTDENLTPLGYHLAQLPMDPKTGKMILFGAMFACLDPILTVAACLDFKDPFVLPLGKEKQADYQKKLLSKDWNSDHIAIIEAFKGWEAAKRCRNEYQFCRENFLSSNILTMIEKMKGQLAGHLYSAKFVESDKPKEKKANVNSDNMKLVRAVVCAGLYPNVAKMIIKHKPNAKPRTRPPPIRTKEDGHVSLHPKSVNCQQGQFESPWLVYHTKLKSSEIFLHDTTMVSAYPLIFFGGIVRHLTEDGKDTVSVDNFIKLQCDGRTAKLFLDLRTQLSNLLNFKITHPGCMSWREDQAEGALINAIVELITSEQVLIQEDLDFFESRGHQRHKFR